MKLQEQATRLAEVVARRKLINNEIDAIAAEHAEALEVAEAEVKKVKDRIAKKAQPLVKQADELGTEESTLRAKILAEAPIGANWQSMYGTVSIQPHPVPKVTRFSSIPKEYRQPEEKCLIASKIRAAKKDEVKIPGLTWVDDKKLVVR